MSNAADEAPVMADDIRTTLAALQAENARLRTEPAWRTIPVLVVTSKDLTPGERLRLNG